MSHENGLFAADPTDIRAFLSLGLPSLQPLTVQNVETSAAAPDLFGPEDDKSPRYWSTKIFQNGRTTRATEKI
jgi:hypothetical protein